MNALVKAIPSILNVLLVCIVFWLIFCIVGVQFFSGKFFKCVDFEGNRLNASIVANESECLQHPENYTWENSQINFDNVLNAYLALFQVVSDLHLCSILKLYDSAYHVLQFTYKSKSTEV